MKSLFSGALLGLLTGGIAVGAASVFAPQPAGNAPPDAPLVDAPQAANDAPEVIETQPEVAEVTAPEPAAPAPGGLDAATPAALPAADTDPLEVPDAADVAADLEAPAEGDAPQIVASGEEPVLPNPQSVAPQVPVSEDDLVVSTQPADAPAEPAPVIVEDVAAADPIAPEPETAPEVVAVVDDTDGAAAAQTDAAPSVGDVVVAPQIVADDAAPEGTAIEDAAEADEVEDAPVIVQAPETIETPEVEETPEVASDAPPEVAPPGVIENDVPTPVAEAAAPTIEDTPALTAPAPGDAEPNLGPDGERPDPVVISVADGSSGSRLPQGVSDIPVNRATATVTDTDDADVAEAVPIDPDAPAIDQFATVFENPEGKPTMSVILIDDGTLADSASALVKVPFPVTVVLDPTVANAAESMAAYRAAGVEVAVLAALPEGARPSDVEVAFGAAFGALPEAVALVDPGEGNLQGDRAVMAQAMAALAEDGRGLVTISRGLNTGVQAAEDAGVPTGLIFRDIDADGQDARVIRRFLDQAAFRARQEPGVILLARVRAETLDALTQWGDANRAGQVAMAPVSAVLAGD